MSEPIEALIDELSAAIDHDLDLTFKTRTGDPQLPAIVQTLRRALPGVDAGAFPTLTPLLSMGADWDLRQEVLKRFDQVDPEAAAQALIEGARTGRTASKHLSSGGAALVFTLQNFTRYGGALVSLKRELASRRAEIKAISDATMDAYLKRELERTIMVLGLDPGQVTEINAGLKNDRPEALDKLIAASSPVDPLLAGTLAELHAFIRRAATTPSDTHDHAIFALSQLARAFDVDAGCFVETIQRFPDSNAYEMSLTGIKRAASRFAQRGERAKFDQLVAGLGDGPHRALLAKHFDSLNWKA